MQQLAMLSATRQRLIQVYNQLAGPLAEQQGFINPTLQKQLRKSCQASLAALEKDRKAIETAINMLIEADSHLSQLFELVTSVPGIGSVVATEIVVATNELKAITDPKKMACHAGVAPFNYQSGSSVRGRPGVSQHARKRLKSLFHLAAMSAIRMKGELQDYYQRKVKEPGRRSGQEQNAAGPPERYSTRFATSSFIEFMLWSTGVRNMTKTMCHHLHKP